MRRRDLSHKELAKVITLRQESASWLKIQRETGIPRRIAQRAHEQYLRSQAREELKAARKEVAAEEFRTHLRLVTGFAESIVLTVCIPSSPNEMRHAKEALKYCLNKLNPDDLFNVIRFSTDVEAFRKKPVSASKSNGRET